MHLCYITKINPDDIYRNIKNRDFFYANLKESLIKSCLSR